MNRHWQRSFDFSFPVEEVWRAYFEMEGSKNGEAPPVGYTFEMNNAARSTIEILDVKDKEFLKWSEAKGDDVTHFTVAFESTATGSQITITRAGFGEGEEFEILRASQLLGFTESMQDLAQYLLTGLARRRHLEDRSSTGVAFREVNGGLEVVRIGKRSLGAEAGLQRGDVVLWIDGAAIYGRTDLWLLQRLYEPGTEVEVGFARDGAVCTGRGRMQHTDKAMVGELGLGPRNESRAG